MVHVDVVFMPLRRGYRDIVVARDSVAGFPEAHMLKKIGAEALAKFLNEEILLRYGTDEQIYTDNAPESVEKGHDTLRQVLERTVATATKPTRSIMRSSSNIPLSGNL
jgi:hypothetical protein